MPEQTAVRESGIWDRPKISGSIHNKLVMSQSPRESLGHGPGDDRDGLGGIRVSGEKPVLAARVRLLFVASARVNTSTL